MHTLLNIEGRPLKFCKFFSNERQEQMAYFYCAARTRWELKKSITEMHIYEVIQFLDALASLVSMLAVSNTTILFSQ